MEWSRSRKWFTIALMGVILPTSLLVTFKLTGIIPEPSLPEIFRAEVLGNNITCPSSSTTYAVWIANRYSDAVVSVNLKVAVGTYHVGSSIFGSYEYLSLKIVATANMSQGFIHSVTAQFLRTSSKNSFVDIEEDSQLLLTECLKIKHVHDYSLESEAYIVTNAVGQPQNCSLTSNVNWIFLNNEDFDHFLKISVETTYYNGTAYRKAVLPIQVGMVPDAGNSMENPRTITPGFYRGYLESDYDPQDFYLIHIGDNQGIEIIMNPPNSTTKNFDLHLHDSGGTKVTSSTREANITEYMFYTNTWAGDWFIEVNATTGYGLYNLTVSLLEIGGG